MKTNRNYGKVVLVYVVKACADVDTVRPQSLLTSALDGKQCLASSPNRFTLGESTLATRFIGR